MKQVTLGGMTADHTNQLTHVEVEVWEVLADGIRRRTDKFELTFAGASLEPAVIKPAVERALTGAGLVPAGTAILTQAEGRS
jgi:hypothetical protein